ncbi:acyl-CoA thioesterase [Streptomyces sp. J2-1]|uniref:acyl-CoA thioesterase n=1 Tax=Streptomyces corallincola TaxID=2851888 RepID=UPI001C394DAE|nr:hotdog domain-containing protein [Streptomyces corallincola]MBV2354533.1 acyl-CoA thioesterase [Streptomyces corallincola]
MTAEAPTAPAASDTSVRDGVPYGRLVPVAVHFDDLDAFGLLHNARYPLLVERAWTEVLAGLGFTFDGDWEAAGDACNVVRELTIGYEAPVKRAGEYAVHLWFERLGSTSLGYGFRFCSADGAETYARGSRVLVRIEAGSGRPTPWSDAFRDAARALLRPAG